MKLSGSGLVTQRNQASLWKVDPRSIHGGQTENLLFGQELRAKRAGREPPPVGPEHSRALGGGTDSHPVDHPVQIVKSPVLPSRPLAALMAAPAEGLVDSHGHGHVVTQLAQGVTEQWVQPVPGGAEEGLRSSQVDLVGLDKHDSSTGLRRLTRVRTHTDRYGHGT